MTLFVEDEEIYFLELGNYEFKRENMMKRQERKENKRSVDMISKRKRGKEERRDRKTYYINCKTINLREEKYNE